ncbi:glutathione S-transferase family protein [Marinobacter lutaoensis]|uniref:Glutathione S-transferase n=1 Tax=Marinobacter lutaoensis TaxID=135739 RepID=A0A1V2DSE3_9GAMM|nr:glutathione S-transferase family protein [Marinobacter lutaoensis]MBE02475.1 glutathione S-transferase family protein [Marinobacter sp.]MBI43881.1 glutathione S-transferase family protein [Oceanospirillales bacterium]NVD35949.1 glutathione S-transferase family protein [Marinobacter lutaoensis]ONF43634.1 glutathione S-transferase [Marinobacter lutaoensis]
MTVRLYQFAISHYSEKVRWALDHKGIRYQPVNLLPGQHMATIRKLTGQSSSVPVLEHDGEIIQGSAAILDYLDATFPEQPLTPADPAARAMAQRWEQRLDEEVGPAVRTWSYHYLLQRPKLMVPMLAAGTPFYNRILLSLAFSRVDEAMRQWMKINARTAEAAAQTLTCALDDLSRALADPPYLAGDRFSRADLTAGALLAPLFLPPQYPVPWPRRQRLPKEMQTQLAQWQPQLDPIADLYRRHR